MTRGSGVFTIPPGVPFARALAQNLLKESDDPAALARTLIFLPTRRACRAVREAFLRESGGRPLLLPRLQPLGDIPEDDGLLPLSAADLLGLKPAINGLRRQLLLAQLVAKSDGGTFQPDRHIPLARALGRLMDQAYTEGLDLKDLPRLVEGTEFAAHWQITVEFLMILSEQWPKILAAEGAIDAADRRNKLINALAGHWRENPPHYPVLAAGSTGSIPAVANLLGVIAALPQGAIILPGLDTSMAEDEWEAIGDTHPQATMKTLLNKLGRTHADIPVWAGTPENITPRQRLAQEMMRPAASADAWQTLHWTAKDTAASVAGIQLYEADTAQEEAEAIALLLRETLESPEQTALVVTPDRNLARRIIQACRKWQIPLDDSAGQPLPQFERARFFLSIAEAAAEGLRPALLLSVFKHRLCCAPFSDGFIATLERDVLRGVTPPPGPVGLKEHYLRKQAAAQKRGRDLGPALGKNLITLNHIMSPFYELFASVESRPLSAYLDAHIALAETLVNSDDLWRREDGESLAGFLTQLRQEAFGLPPIAPADYPVLLRELMREVTLRPPYGTHPRLAIMGQLEARLVQADRLILAGLNEGSWPADVQPDPFLSRPMKRDFGLPPPERAIGLAAHDFVQGFCTPDVYLTRAKKVDGTPTIPSRWLARLDTVLSALGLDPQTIRAPHIGAWIAQYYTVPDIQSFERPSPKPPADLRPNRLSVTRIDHWIKDPYGIYAEFILGLKKLDALEEEPDAAARGTLIHAILEDFIAATENDPVLPPDAESQFLSIAQKRLPDFIPAESDRAILWPRLVRLAGYFIAQENDWRRTARPGPREVKARWTIQPGERPFTLSGVADRIDRLSDGTAAIIDYKTGKSGLSKKGIETAALPQLPLEALMLEDGAFENCPAQKTGALAYWVVNGGRTPEKPIVVEGAAAIDQSTAAARAVLENLIVTFENPDMPYYALPVPANAPRFNDYLHLARVAEWTALDDSGGEDE